jgi:hypothetical protein
MVVEPIVVARIDRVWLLRDLKIVKIEHFAADRTCSRGAGWCQNTSRKRCGPNPWPGLAPMQTRANWYQAELNGAAFTEMHETCVAMRVARAADAVLETMATAKGGLGAK